MRGNLAAEFLQFRDQLILGFSRIELAAVGRVGHANPFKCNLNFGRWSIGFPYIQ